MFPHFCINCFILPYVWKLLASEVFTSVLTDFYSSFTVDYFDPSLSETSGPNQIPLQTHVTRLHRELLALVPRYCAIESWSKELKLRDSKRNQDHPSNKEELRRFLLEITANLVGYCRTVIVRSGEISCFLLNETVFSNGCYGLNLPCYTLS